MTPMTASFAADPIRLRPAHLEREEFTVLEEFLGAAALAPLVAEANALRGSINRNFVPGMKKGGSVSYFDVRRHAPTIHALYHSPAFIAWLSALTGATLLTCPESDAHACALYYYTEAGDHIGWHYDTSFYRGQRFTVLLGLVQQSRSELVARLYHKSGARPEEEVRVASHPGTLVVFNGDRCWHMVTPCGAGEDRVMLSMEYVTDRHMGLLPRLVSTVKDAVAYFGIRALLPGGR
ncbi:MAG: 2OG-Fe(II) oxygenase [Gemmatimonadota bacterium]|nr:2OG-Fe(II) oxygenase [Gemmatimonadota bacterium]